jgi:hypothetical protein
MAPAQRPIILPRVLIFLTSIWLIGSWIIAIGFKTPVQPSPSSYEPGVRRMMLCVTIGLMIAWPLLRLSQEATRFPIWQTILDLLVLVSMVQLVVWPLRLVTTWSIERTAAIDAVILGWLLLAGAVVAASTGARSAGPRILGMLACTGMCLLGPIAAVVGVMSGAQSLSLVEMSPLMAVQSLGLGGGGPVRDQQWMLIILLHAAALIVWTTLIVWSLVTRRTPER